ncbi:complement decay-accelerating factor isoform X2 [Centroberyx affinis]|uniref:complement decay-accelerating factor isoform X2 n=1 Tax=Centroberyx affinis TaxID=166261 RepID=UPI003A5C310D
MEVSLDTCGRRMVKSLLLLYLFVVRAAADCPKPQGTENIALTNEALLKNDFPDGSEATFECANGYVLEDGSGTVTCTNGVWTTPQLNCIKKDCGPPKPQQHMSFDVTEGTLFGASVRILCDEGYRLSGTSYKRCYATGWFGRAKCEVVTCAKPDEVTNGRNTWDSQTDPIYGDTVQYVCDEGYTLTGNHIIKCSRNGQYNSPPPECNGGTDILTTVDNFLVAVAPTTTDSSATPTTHRDKIFITSATPTASPPVRATEKGGIFLADILTTEDKITTTRVTPTASPPVRGKRDDVETNEDIGYAPVIVSVICTLIVVVTVLFISHRFLLKRKGSVQMEPCLSADEHL